MKTELIQILLFCTVPIGIIALIFSIKSLKKVFYPHLLLEFSYKQKQTTFRINKAGKFEIWHKGELFKKNPINQFELKITKIDNGKKINLKHSLLKTHVNGFKYGRMKLFYFQADEGEYSINLINGTSISQREEFVSNLIPLKEMNPNEYYIQIRESQSVFKTFLSILFTIISGLLIIGGIVFGLLAKQLFN